MRIVIDARMYKESGIGRYIRNLVYNLQIIDKNNEYIIFKPEIPWYGLREQLKLPRLLKPLNPDLVHFPHFNVPILYRGKYVVTVHDLIHQHFFMERVTTHGSIVYKIKQAGYKKIFNNALTRSKAILVPSNFVKEQLINECNVLKNKITVTNEAVDDKILTAGNKMTEKIGFPYIFYVGNAHPHKNVEGLIKAYLILKKKYPTLKLVLAGHDHYFWQRIKQEYSTDGIKFVGQISDEELLTYYKNAKVFVMPSFEEGFGIPLLEAMACNCPVVSSKLGSLPEVGGDAVLYFDPYDLNDMVKEISRVLDDEKLRKKLIEKGMERYKQFSWKKLAERTLEVYQKCV